MRVTAAILSICDCRGSSTSPRAGRGICYRFLSLGTVSFTMMSAWCGSPTHSSNCGLQVKPLDHSHELPPPGKKGRTYICSCMIFLRPTEGAKLLLRKWIEELKVQPWSKQRKSNDQPGFNWALNKTAGQVCFSSISSIRMQQNGNVNTS